MPWENLFWMTPDLLALDDKPTSVQLQAFIDDHYFMIQVLLSHNRSEPPLSITLWLHKVRFAASAILFPRIRYIQQTGDLSYFKINCAVSSNTLFFLVHFPSGWRCVFLDIGSGPQTDSDHPNPRRPNAKETQVDHWLCSHASVQQIHPRNRVGSLTSFSCLNTTNSLLEQW